MISLAPTFFDSTAVAILAPPMRFQSLNPDRTSLPGSGTLINFILYRNRM